LALYGGDIDVLARFRKLECPLNARNTGFH
jgi:hypothetical protein